MSDSGCIIPANPDVSGIGIRISVYVTSFILALIPDIPQTASLSIAIRTAAGLQGFSLLITGLVQTHSRQLSLYHAIIILHLVSFLGIALHPTGAYRATMSRIIVIAFATWSAFAVLISWTIYVWTTAPTFGPENLQRCNDHIKYVLLWINIRATVPWWRWLMVASYGIGLFFLVVVPIITGAIFLVAHRKISSGEPTRWTITYGPQDDASDPLGDNRNGIISRILLVTYGTIMLELIVKRNRDIVEAGEAQWGFGQIVAVLILLGPANEILHFILGFWEGPSLEFRWGDGIRQLFSFGRSNKDPVATGEELPYALSPIGARASNDLSSPPALPASVSTSFVGPS